MGAKEGGGVGVKTGGRVAGGKGKWRSRSANEWEEEELKQNRGSRRRK